MLPILLIVVSSSNAMVHHQYLTQEKMQFVPRKLECNATIERSGVYMSGTSECTTCKTQIVVPKYLAAIVYINNNDCPKIESNSFKAICEQPTRQIRLTQGSYALLRDPSEVFPLHVLYVENFEFDCGDIAHGVHTLARNSITLVNRNGSHSCTLRILGSVRLSLTSFTSTKRNCCPEVFLTSHNKDSHLVDNSPSKSACEINKSGAAVESRCLYSVLHMRSTNAGDKISFDVIPLLRDDCEPAAGVGVPPPKCRRRVKERHLYI